MKRQFITLIIIFAALFSVGGFTAVNEGLEVIGEVFKGFWPIFSKVVEQSLEDYLTSAYFIVGVIILIFSSVGIVISIKARKILYFIISLILDIISIFSIISNLVLCK